MYKPQSYALVQPSCYSVLTDTEAISLPAHVSRALGLRARQLSQTSHLSGLCGRTVSVRNKRLISDIEHGRCVTSIPMLQVLALSLDLELSDLLQS